MKIIIGLILCLSLTITLYAQDFGIRGNYCLSNTKNINNGLGLGIYLNINDFSKKIEALISLDFTAANKPSSTINTYYSSIAPTISALYYIEKKEKFKLSVGPSLSYYIITANTIDNLSDIWSYNSRDIGLGIIVKSQFARIFNSEFNIDIFLAPNYLINTYTKNDPTGTNPIYSNPLKIFDLQVGVSYNL